MTAEDYDKLTTEEQRIKVCEALGPEGLGLWYWEMVEDCLGGDLTSREYLPDYLNDLNACHEMEKKVDGDEYWPTLWEVITGDAFPIAENQGHVVDIVARVGAATAAQRSKAFVLTMTAEEA